MTVMRVSFSSVTRRATWLSTFGRLVAVGGVVAVALNACGGHAGNGTGADGSLGPGGPVGLSTRPLNGVSTGGPDVVVCGQKLWSGAETPLLYELPIPSKLLPLTLTAGISQPPVLLRTSSSCQKGAQVKIDPPSRLAIVGEAHAKDGLPTAIALLPGSGVGPATVTVTVPPGPPLRAAVTVVPQSPGS